MAGRRGSRGVAANGSASRPSRGSMTSPTHAVASAARSTTSALQGCASSHLVEPRAIASSTARSSHSRSVSRSRSAAAFQAARTSGRGLSVMRMGPRFDRSPARSRTIYPGLIRALIILSYDLCCMFRRTILVCVHEDEHGSANREAGEDDGQGDREARHHGCERCGGDEPGGAATRRRHPRGPPLNNPSLHGERR